MTIQLRDTIVIITIINNDVLAQLVTDSRGKNIGNIPISYNIRKKKKCRCVL